MATSDEQKISEWYKCAVEGRKRALRREKYLSGFAVFVVIICLALIACALGFVVLGAIEVIQYLGRLEVRSGLFFKKRKKRKANLPFNDQPERRSIIWIDIFTLSSQDEDTDPYKNPSGLVVAHHGLLGSTPRGK